MWVACLFVLLFVELLILVICFVGWFWLIVWLALGLCCLNGWVCYFDLYVIDWCMLCFVWLVV